MTDITEKKKKFQVEMKDLNMAAFVWSQDGSELYELREDRNKSSIVYFRFEVAMSEEEYRDLVLRYANGNTLVDPLRFQQNQAKLKDLIHSRLKRG